MGIRNVCIQDGGLCGTGGYCDECPNIASERNKPERDVAPERKEGPDCRLCKNHELHRETSPRHQCLLLSRTALVCINGDAFVPAAEPVRLYAGGET